MKNIVFSLQCQTSNGATAPCAAVERVRRLFPAAVSSVLICLSLAVVGAAQAQQVIDPGVKAVEASEGNAEQPLTMELAALIAAAVKNHPSIASARQAYEAALKEEDAAKSRGWPSLTLVLEGGGRKLENPAQRYVRVQQDLWGGGRLQASEDVARRSVRLFKMRLAQQEKNIEIQVIDAWQAAHAAMGRIEVAQRLLSRLREHESLMRRRVQSGLSADIELQQVNAQLLQVAVDRRKAQTNLSLAITRLGQLTGREVNFGQADSFQKLLAVPATSRSQLAQLLTQDWNSVASALAAVSVADAEVGVAIARVEVKRSELRPQLYARIDQPLSGGGKAAGFVGVRYSIDAGLPQDAEIASLLANVASLEADRNTSLIEAKEKILSDLDEVQEHAERYGVLESSVLVSERIHDSYIRQFVANKKSWLDVMNSIRDLAQNEYSLSDARVGYSGLLQRLEAMRQVPPLE